eukprot:CAMPEP_0116146136 /NCGR_PEP_ID=MMETSP0329-20121206/17000_1 /TAXON_ID=697910 /ORGANISM="Pseudo-nitzschia arenysensis, Strain B593" /LENGTH=477 /DNA_ID=CAMNT_0003641857 /DNA_START=263 /DNA_END=1696 /DNA_ORIENTATION=-
MPTIQHNESSNDDSGQQVHVELTQELTAEHEVKSYLEYTSVTTPTKDRSFASEDETFPESPMTSVGDYRSILSGESWGTYTIAEMNFTVMSNLLFFVASSIQTYTGIVDLTSAMYEESRVWDDDSDDDDYVYTALDRTYYVLYSFAPLLCIFSALVDLRYYKGVTAVSLWSWSFWCPCFVRNEDASEEIENLDEQAQQVQYQRIVEVDTTNVERINSFVEDEQNSFSTMESSVAENPYYHLAAALLFGLGGCFEFYSTFLYDHYEDVDCWDDDAYLIKEEMKRAWFVSNYRIDFIGMHLYLLSGVMSLIAQRDSFRSGWRCVFSECRSKSSRSNDSSYRTAQFLMLLGSVLFVGGTLLDCTISWISDPLLRHDMDPALHLNQVALAWFGLTSNLMWNIDAILYMISDVFIYSLHEKGSEGQKWLFKNACAETDEDTEDEENIEQEEYCYNKDDESMPMIRPLERGSSITSYSSIVMG